MELYEDKKLNQEIMSSMLPVHRGSFFGPVYQFVAMLASLAMPYSLLPDGCFTLNAVNRKNLLKRLASL